MWTVAVRSSLTLQYTTNSFPSSQMNENARVFHVRKVMSTVNRIEFNRIFYGRFTQHYWQLSRMRSGNDVDGRIAAVAELAAANPRH